MDRKGACRGCGWQRLQTCPDTALLTPRTELWDHLVEHVSINFEKKKYLHQWCHKPLKDLNEKGHLKTLDENTLVFHPKLWMKTYRSISNQETTVGLKMNHGSYKLKPCIRLIRLFHSLSTGIPGQD